MNKNAIGPLKYGGSGAKLFAADSVVVVDQALLGTHAKREGPMLANQCGMRYVHALASKPCKNGRFFEIKMRFVKESHVSIGVHRKQSAECASTNIMRRYEGVFRKFSAS